MISITRKEADYIRDVGFRNYVKMSSKTHKSGSKRYWLVENPRVLKALDNYRNNGKIGG